MKGTPWSGMSVCVRVYGRGMTLTTLTVFARDGFELRAQRGGPKGAPTLVLLQGQANSHRWWTGLRERFEDSLSTLTIDYRGTGGSRGPVEEWTTDTFADDVADVLGYLNISSAAVYGTSMGGRIAQKLAISRPGLVSALILACTSPGGELAVERSTETRLSIARAEPGEGRRVLHDLFYTPQWPGTPERSHLLGDPTMSRAEARAHLRVSGRHDASAELGQITAPTLVLHGDDDLMTPVVNAERLAEHIPGADLTTYPGYRHGFFEELADQVTAEVRNHLVVHGVLPEPALV